MISQPREDVGLKFNPTNHMEILKQKGMTRNVQSVISKILKSRQLRRCIQIFIKNFETSVSLEENGYA